MPSPPFTAGHAVCRDQPLGITQGSLLNGGTWTLTPLVTAQRLHPPMTAHGPAHGAGFEAEGQEA